MKEYIDFLKSFKEYKYMTEDIWCNITEDERIKIAEDVLKRKDDSR